MWLWIGTGIATYLALLIMTLAIGAAAKMADRRDRAIFASWLEDRRKRGPRPRDVRSGDTKAA